MTLAARWESRFKARLEKPTIPTANAGGIFIDAFSSDRQAPAPLTTGD
jgi:hypothetical protein